MSNAICIAQSVELDTTLRNLYLWLQITHGGLITFKYHEIFFSRKDSKMGYFLVVF